MAVVLQLDTLHTAIKQQRRFDQIDLHMAIKHTRRYGRCCTHAVAVIHRIAIEDTG